MPLFSVFIVHGYVHNFGSGYDGQIILHCHLYIIPMNHLVNDSVAFSYISSFYMMEGSCVGIDNTGEYNISNSKS